MEEELIEQFARQLRFGVTEEEREGEGEPESSGDHEDDGRKIPIPETAQIG
jgi:hypothetical protein